MSSIIGNDVTQVKPTTEEEASCMAMCLATWSVPSMVFKTVLELHVIDIIYAAGPDAQLSAADIVAQLPTKNPNAASMLDRMLRLLASFTILTCTHNVGPDGRALRLYGLGPVCQFLAKNDDEVSYAAFATLMHDQVIMDTWVHLKDAVLEGGVPFRKNYGQCIFDYLGTDSRFYKVFYDGMDHHSTIVMKKIMDIYQGFEGINTLVDVGGATGLTLSMIIAKYPSIKAINFDLPHIIRDAPTYPGVEHVAGNMYDSVPKGDAIFMKWTFQSGTDEQCEKLLKNCYESLPEDGKVIICEYVMPETPETSYQAHTAFIWDAIMLTFPEGKSRTKQEYEELGKQAGFHTFRVVGFACDTWVMEYLKN
ncbi:caffeic acid 3-O-methyltransferase-like [Amaranthus tricolor]|uniref:caffeic acid 3-O-methyltransferase-like n=1 Tax=Amaranthus tricolor TaxID=29722 RepID=UPI00258ACD98|nr:caffeic acid 3-O-methyltransferase-like [Amaranthus tricolor]